MSLSGTENEHKGNGRTSEMKDIGQQVYAEADCMDCRFFENINYILLIFITCRK